MAGSEWLKAADPARKEGAVLAPAVSHVIRSKGESRKIAHNRY
jgi:hypothetical protein